MGYIGTPVQQALTKTTSQYFNGTGSQTVFTLNRAVNVPEDLEVFVNNIQQEPGVGKSYTATGTTLTFDAAPSSGTGNIYVIYRGLAEVTRRLEHDPNAALAATTGTFSDGITVDKNGATVATFDRATSDGSIVDFQKSGTTVGDIGVNNGDNLRIQGNSAHSGIEFGTNAIFPHKNSSNVDATIDLGESTLRWKDLYLSGGVVFGTGGPSPITSNTLDDYEEGTHNVTDLSGAGLSIITNRSYYVKIGSIVNFQASINVPSNSNSNSLQLSLPFSSNIGGFFAGTGVLGYSTISSSSFPDLSPMVNNSGSNIIFYWGNASGFSNADASGHRIDFWVQWQRT